jgi:hypothetical protein
MGMIRLQYVANVTIFLVGKVNIRRDSIMQKQMLSLNG